MSEYKRTVTVIDKKMQMHYLTVWLVAAMSLILVGFTFYYFFRHRAESAGTRIPQAYLQLLVGNGFFILFLSLLMGCYAVLHSHRVAGPAYRINQCLKRLCTDDYGFVVSLRDGDYLQDLAANMNTLILRLRERNEKALKAREEILLLKQAIGSGSPVPAEVVAQLERLVELLPIPMPATPAAASAPGGAPAAPSAAPPTGGTA